MQWNITLHQCQSLLRYDHGNKLHTMTYFIKTKDLKYVETTNCEHHWNKRKIIVLRPFYGKLKYFPLFMSLCVCIGPAGLSGYFLCAKCEPLQPPAVLLAQLQISTYPHRRLPVGWPAALDSPGSALYRSGLSLSIEQHHCKSIHQSFSVSKTNISIKKLCSFPKERLNSDYIDVISYLNDELNAVWLTVSVCCVFRCSHILWCLCVGSLCSRNLSLSSSGCSLHHVQAGNGPGPCLQVLDFETRTPVVDQ